VLVRRRRDLVDHAAAIARVRAARAA